MALRTAGLVALVAVLLVGVATAQDWQDGRATFFADTWDPWQMSHGSCMYGFLKPDRCTGWDVAALSDRFPGYDAPSKNCGVCYEVKCRPASFTDGYGAVLDRTQDCNGAGGSVVVQVVDTCACVYPDNAFSNKRWCCGDIPHFDLSVWAFEKLGPKGKGVIAVSWRQVDCSTRPSNPAPVPPSGPTPMNPTELAGTNAASTDGRPCNGANVAGRRRRPSLPKAKSTGVRLSSWSMNKWNGQGVTGRSAQACGTVMPWGGLTLSAAYGSRKQLVFWVKADNVGSLSLKAYGSGACQSRNLGSLRPVGQRGAYKRYSVNTRNFGCRVNKMTINNGWKFQSLCVDQARIV